jgi:hypothetical protein
LECPTVAHVLHRHCGVPKKRARPLGPTSEKVLAEGAVMPLLRRHRLRG